MQEHQKILEAQRQFFASGKTLSLSFRLEQLHRLKQLVKTHEQEICDALKKDLNKSLQESFLTEIYLILEEIDLAVKSLKKWMKPKKVATPFPLLWPGRSEIYYEPYGIVLILAPWNYPFNLLISPLVGAIAAGNCVILKPSEVAAHTQELMIRLINCYFPSEYICAIAADPEQTKALLEEKFDYIFFTGGTEIGKVVMAAAAKHLTPVTLELGGKSPCIVDQTADLNFAAHRIAFGKGMNAGQTCIAPDYLYVQRSCKEELIRKLQAVLTKFYGQNPEKGESYGRIINRKHFDRLTRLIKGSQVIYGGQNNPDECYIAPTLIDQLSWDDPIMKEEIFGPLLPILTFDKIEEVIQTIKERPKPLALYYFTKDTQNRDKVLSEVSFGSGCINDCVMQIANSNFAFGGVGNSGMGGYHGEYSFKTFSHHKSIYRKTWLLSTTLEYPPFSSSKLKWLKRLLKIRL